MWDLLWHSSSLAGPNSLAFSNPHFQILFPITSLTCLTWQTHLFPWSEELLQDLCQEEHDGSFLLILRSTWEWLWLYSFYYVFILCPFSSDLNSILHATLLTFGVPEICWIFVLCSLFIPKTIFPHSWDCIYSNYIRLFIYL